MQRGRLTRPAAVVVALAALAATVLVAGRRAEAQWPVDCAAPNQVFDAATMPADLDLTAADVVLLTSGTFLGPVNAGGATICVDTAATFAPSTINGQVHLLVRGTAALPALAAETGAVLDNEGTVTFTAPPNVNGLATVFNRTTGTITVAGASVSLGPGLTLTNDGVIDVAGSVNLNGGSVTNNATLSIGGSLTSDATVTNTGDMTVGGLLTLNAQGVVDNSCRLTSDGVTNNGAVTNSGVVTLGDGTLLINGSGSWDQPATAAVTSGAGFTNNGGVTGTGGYLFTGTTANQGTMTGDAGAPIVFFDTSQTGGQILDIESGAQTNVVRAEVAIPPPGACAAGPPPTTSSTTTTVPDPTSPTTAPGGTVTSAPGGGPATSAPGPAVGGATGQGTLPATGDDHTGDLVALAASLLVAGAVAAAAGRARRLAEEGPDQHQA